VILIPREVPVSSKYKIVVDENMPGIERLFGDIAEIVKVNGREVSNQILLDADALLCRSITPVNQALLKGTRVKFVGTATIGTDHLDTRWLQSQLIQWSNAAGCNAAAVAQYVLSAVSFWCLKRDRKLQELTIGIVGAGNVGSELARCLDSLKINYFLCDPPLREMGDKRIFVELSEILNCDVVTLHVPLEKKGKYPTFHLLDNKELNQLNNNGLLINASRGAVINNQSLTEYLQCENSADAAIDVFENEPKISNKLLSRVLLGTPHIAGHTLEGKLRGSWLIYKAFCESFDEKMTKQEDMLYPDKNICDSQSKNIEELFLEVYDIELDSLPLKQTKSSQVAAQFDVLRKNATQLSNGKTRRDYSGWSLPSLMTPLG